MTPILSNKDKILELETRRKIYNVVRTYSGCHFRDIERKADMPASSVKYHLNYLSKYELIKEEKDGNNVRYFPNEFSEENKKLLILLRQRSVRKIILFILNNKNCDYEDIVSFLRLSPSTVSWHLKKLVRKEIVKTLRTGRKLKYSLKVDEKEIMRLLIRYKESFFDSLVNKTIDMWEIG